MAFYAHVLGMFPEYRTWRRWLKDNGPALLLRGGMVLLLPLLWGIDGIWWAVVAAEGLAVLVSLAFLISQRKRYHYA